MFQDIYYARDILYERLWIAEARFSPRGGGGYGQMFVLDHCNRKGEGFVRSSTIF